LYLCGFFGLWLLNGSPTLNSLLLKACSVEISKVAALLVVINTLGAIALFQFLLGNTAFHCLDPRLTNSESARTEHSYASRSEEAMKNKVLG
jgi:hypothetical protein